MAITTKDLAAVMRRFQNNDTPGIKWNRAD